MDAFKFPDEDTSPIMSGEELADDKVEFSIEGEGEVDVEVVDDTPPEDKNRKPLEKPVDEVTDEELENYGDKVKKRISELSHARHDERRAKEAIERQARELEAYTQRVLEEIIDRLRRSRWNERDVFAVQLALEEALINAIKHGNGDDPAKRVCCCCRIASDLVRIEIADEGDGFDPASLPNPTDNENMCTPSGRGVMLMQNFMCRVEFNEKGNRVVMEKGRGSSHEVGVEDPGPDGRAQEGAR